MEFRTFFTKVGVQPNATASIYMETVQSTKTAKTAIEETRATKLTCSIYGPMQKQNDASGAGQEQCAIKVTIEFADILRSDQILLE